MKGDFSRDSYDRLKHFRRVLFQQGRVQIDADWNEQVSILLHYIQTLAMDIIGPYAGPVNMWGFGINVNDNTNKLLIGAGRYYVDGVLCENEKEIEYVEQAHKPEIPQAYGSYMVYLDVWERHITFLEDDDIREKALGGVDTATRTMTVWQVKMKKLPEKDTHTCLDGASSLGKELAISRASLRARARMEQEQTEPCLVEPEASYRGPENQLYRVEVHRSGSLGTVPPPTFKWSRENGSVVFPIRGIKSADTDMITLELDNLGRDDRFGLEVNDWVEYEDDASVLNNLAGSLSQVLKVDRVEMTVTLKVSNQFSLGTHALLRRWDQKKGEKGWGVEITESNNVNNGWLELEDGIRIQFDKEGIYRTGDYWLIPARTALGDVEWPLFEEMENHGKLAPKFLPPRGVLHHLAPLAIVSIPKSKEGSYAKMKVENDCRCSFKPLSYDCSYSHYGQLGIGIGVDLLCPE